jgi:hypothetical protein
MRIPPSAFSCCGCALALLLLTQMSQSQEAPYRPVIPKSWDEAALANWATPVTGLNVRPSHISAEQYYAMPVDNLRTYPVYRADREPSGYWEMFNRVGPQPLIETDKLRSEADWIEAGRNIFHGADHLHLRTLDSTFIKAAKSWESEHVLPDGTMPGMRWVPTIQGVALGFPSCAGCHTHVLPDGTRVDGATAFSPLIRPQRLLVAQVQLAKGFVTAGTPIHMEGEPLGIWLYRAFGVPWQTDDVHVRLKSISQTEYLALVAASTRGGAVPRWNGSLYYPTKVPDLIGIKDRKYMDHTGTHLNRGIGDLMRYAALVSFAEPTEFGPHQMIVGDAGRPKVRRSDEALFALSLYLQSLQPPPNPNPVTQDSIAGEGIFKDEGCAKCHAPPLYTNNRLTPVDGFIPPPMVPVTLDVMRNSVGTDPGLALNTRKGTGYYKVPSLKGAWYRGYYLHDGAAASLEEMFNPGRLSDTHVRGGYTPPGKTRSRAMSSGWS